MDAFLALIIAGTLSLVTGKFVSSEVLVRSLKKILRVEDDPPISYKERLVELTSNLTAASKEVDSVLNELSQVARSRERSVAKLEAELSTLETRGQELKENIETLESVPIPAAEHFARLIESGERRSAKRDYMLFGAGVIVTTVIAIVIEVFTRK